jgi:hypothetical protein
MGSAVGVALICLLVWSGSAMALSYDGTVSVEYSGTRDQSFVYDPTNPAVWQGRSDPPAVGVTAQTPDRGFEIQSSAPETGQCGVMNQVAKAIEVTISRESGAQRAHRTGAAGRQNRKLVALSKSFERTRGLERTAGSSLARTLRAYRVAVRMTAGQVQTAESGLLGALRRHNVTAADVAVVKRALLGRELDVLNTLGR